MSRSRIVLLGSAVLGLTALFVLQLRSAPTELTTESRAALELYELGRAATYALSHGEAADHYKKAIEADADFAMAHIKLYGSLSQLDQPDEAVVALERAFELREGLSELERLEIEIVYDVHHMRYDDLMSKADILIGKYPKATVALQLQMQLSMMNREYQTAIECLEEMLTLEPTHVKCHRQLGQINMHIGNYDEAISSLRRYVFYAPDSPEPYEQMGIALFNLGRYDESVKNFLRALELEPTSASAAQHLAGSYSLTGQFDKARKLLEHMEPVFNTAESRRRRDMALFELAYLQRDWPRILEIAEGLKPFPTEVERGSFDFPVVAYLFESVALMEMGSSATAEASIDSMNVYIERILAVYPETEDVKESVRLLDALVTSRLSRAQGRPASGIAELRSAIDESAFSPHTLASYRVELARAYLATGSYAEVAAQAEAVLSHVPAYPDMLFLGAKAQLKMGDRDAARLLLGRYLDEMKDANDGHPDVIEALALGHHLAPNM